VILNLATFLLVIAAAFYTMRAAQLTQINKFKSARLDELENKIEIRTMIINDLEQTNLQYQFLNKKLTNELQLWKYRRKLLKEVPVSFRKKKIRGKKRKVQK
jgi:hypothetical protein